MITAKTPSEITLPQNTHNWQTVLDFLVEKFHQIPLPVWQDRIERGKVHFKNGEPIDKQTNYRTGKIVCYYREVDSEPKIPFKHDVLYKDHNILVACKPHFLPVTPGGKYINECLLEKIRLDLPEEQANNLVALHRLDKDTAGIVLFSLNSNTRAQYYELFSKRLLKKQYRAVANIGNFTQQEMYWQVENRLKRGTPRFLMTESAGEPNAISKIQILKTENNLGLFHLNPITGKMHQLRKHMEKIGFPILNDPFYPILKAEATQNFHHPLQLLAQKISFIDPISGFSMTFKSKRKLMLSE